MNVIEIILTGSYFFIPLLLALGAVLAFAFLLHAERNFGSWVSPLLIPVIALGICVSSLLSGRSLTFAATDLSLDTAGLGGGGSTALRALTIALLGISLARIGGEWLRKDRTQTTGGTVLFVAFVAYFLTNSLTNSMFGTQPAFIHNLFYPIFIFSAAYAARRQPIIEIVSAAKVALYAMMFLSLITAIVKPELAMEPGYKGWIPGLTNRLWGVGSNANSIGPLALVVLLLEYMQPYSKKWIRWLCVAAAFLVFLLAQSKTVWFSGLLLVAVLFWYRADKQKKGVDIRIVLGLICIASFLVFWLLILDPISLWEKFIRSKIGSEIITFTGRGQIWSVAINAWLDNPAFGYGPEIWGTEYRAQIGMQFAFSAHNQFLQSLSAAGALGFVCLMIYLWLLGRYAVQASNKTKGVALALFLLTILRSMTETPLAINTLFNGEFLVHLLLFQIVIRDASLARQQSSNGINLTGMRLHITTHLANPREFK